MAYATEIDYRLEFCTLQKLQLAACKSLQSAMDSITFNCIALDCIQSIAFSIAVFHCMERTGSPLLGKIFLFFHCKFCLFSNGEDLPDASAGSLWKKTVFNAAKWCLYCNSHRSILWTLVWDPYEIQKACNSLRSTVSNPYEAYEAILTKSRLKVPLWPMSVPAKH